MMTSNTAPSPFVASASSEWTPSFKAYFAFSGLIGGVSDFWAASGSTGWLKLDCGAVVDIVGYVMSPRNTVASCPADWTFEGSNDDSAWTTLDTQTSITWTANIAKHYTISLASYRYYRMNCSANNGDAQLALAELMLEIPAPSGGDVSIINRRTNSLNLR